MKCIINGGVVLWLGCGRAFAIRSVVRAAYLVRFRGSHLGCLHFFVQFAFAFFEI